MKKYTLISTLIIAGCANTSLASLYWVGGAGNNNWNTTDLNWSTTSGGAANSAWVAGEDAIFEGVGVALEVTENVSVSSIAVDGDGYTTNSGTANTIDFSGTRTLDVSTGNTFQINSDFTSDGDLNRNGDGIFNINTTASNMNGNDFIVNAGTTRFTSGGFTDQPGSFTGGIDIFANNGATIENVNAHSIQGHNAPHRLNFTDSTFTLTRELYVNQLNLTGATLNGPNEIRADFFGALNLTSNASANTTSIQSRVSLGANDRTGNFTINDGAAAIDLEMTSNLNGNANTTFNKNGAGTMRFAGAGNHAGTTNINDGTLILDGTLGGTMTVGDVGTSTATLTGSGTASGATTITLASTLDPDTKLIFSDSLTIETGAIFKVELTGNGLNDSVEVTNALVLDGLVDVNLDGYAAMMGDIFDLADFGSISGGPTFDFTDATLTAGLTWDTSNFLTDGTISVIPEPSQTSLLGIGLLGLFLRRKR